MKTKNKMISILLMTGILYFSGCSDDRETSYAGDNQTVVLSVTEVSLTPEEQSFTVDVTTDHEFTAYTSDDWLSVTPEYTIALDTTLTVTVEENTDTVARNATVTVLCGGTRRSIAVTQSGVTVEETEITAPDGYTLVWNDEFNGTELGGDWTYEIQSAGWVNNELQTYVKDTEVTTVSDGTLKINLIKNGDDVKSARIYAKYKEGWQYGYIEASIKLPTGKGTWPAFWMMPVNYTSWPDDGEIDIMESVGYNPNVVVSTIHCNKYNNTGTSIESASMSVPTSQTEFHVYALEWTEDELIFYVDGEVLLTYANDGTGTDAWPFDAPFYVILNLAWGGDWGGLNGVDESALPATMEVEYVRVFQRQ